MGNDGFAGFDSSIFDLAQRAALVTGSTQGIGAAIADALEACGAGVLRHGLSTLDESAGGDTLLFDLTAPDAPQNLIRAAFERAPNLDILVCNAGSFFDLPFLEMTPQAWEKTIHLNLRAPYFLIQEWARRLVSQGRGGAALIVSSTNGFQAELDSSAYDTAKGALVMMTRTLALSLAEYSIRVNALAPGLIRTPLTARWMDEDSKLKAHYEKNIPIGRVGMPHDCAGAAAFLVSDAASYITGQALIVDGGLTIRQIGPL